MGLNNSKITVGRADTRSLYFIGEMVDVTGWLGGYNFQEAWASGFACAQALAAKHVGTGLLSAARKMQNSSARSGALSRDK